MNNSLSQQGGKPMATLPDWARKQLPVNQGQNPHPSTVINQAHADYLNRRVGTPAYDWKKSTAKVITMPNGVTRVSLGGFGMLPYVGESQAAIQAQIALANQMRAAGKSNNQIGKAMRELAKKYNTVAVSSYPHPTQPPVIEE